MKILLANPANCKSDLTKNYDHHYPNLGLLYVAGQTKKMFPDYEIKYVEGDVSLSKYLNSIEKWKPDIIGISFATFVAPLAYETINALKQIDQNLPIVCGGPHPTIDPMAVLSNTKADFCVIGEGENTFVDLLRHFNGEISVENIKGIAYRRNGQIIVNENRDFEKNINHFSPLWELVDVNKYLGLTIRKAYPQNHVLVSRGCPFNCTFCSNPVWKSNKPWLRIRDPLLIQNEIKMLYEKGVREIFLRADEFNCSLKWAKSVCDSIIDLGYKDLYFTCNLRVDKLDEEFAEKLSKMKCWLVHIGIESGNQRVIDGINKRYTLTQVINACELFKRYNIKVFGYFMMYSIWEDEKGQLCYEAPDEVKNTINFVKTLSKNSLLHYISWNFCTPYKGARLYDIAVKHGIISPDYDGDPFKVNVKLGISKKQMHKSLALGILLQFYLVLKNKRFELRLFNQGIHKIVYALRAFLKVMSYN